MNDEPLLNDISIGLSATTMKLPSLVDVLRPETLHHCLSYSDCWSLGTAASVCRLFVALSDEQLRLRQLQDASSDLEDTRGCGAMKPRL